MISTVTLVHNQENNLPTILKAYSNQSLLPELFIFVLDRCTDNSKKIIEEFAIRFPTKIVENTSGNGFLAGYCRDLGLSESNTNTLFLDGDCIPSENLFREFDNALDVNEPSIAISKRINLCEDKVSFLPDSRETTPWYVNWIFGDENITITHLEVARVRMLTWSCSLGLNKLAILKIKEINEILGFGNRLFPTNFDGKWGGEDDHIGHVAMFMNMRVIGLSTRNTVTHIWHKSRTNTQYEAISNQTYDTLKEYFYSINSPGFHYSLVDIDGHVYGYLNSISGLESTNNVIIDEPFDE